MPKILYVERLNYKSNLSLFKPLIILCLIVPTNPCTYNSIHPHLIFQLSLCYFLILRLIEFIIHFHICNKLNKENIGCISSHLLFFIYILLSKYCHSFRIQKLIIILCVWCNFHFCCFVIYVLTIVSIWRMILES